MRHKTPPDVKGILDRYPMKKQDYEDFWKWFYSFEKARGRVPNEREIEGRLMALGLEATTRSTQTTLV